MTRALLFILLLPAWLHAGSQRIISEPNASKETNAAININFQDIDTKFKDVSFKSRTEDIVGEKHFGTITVTSATIATLYVTTTNITFTTLNATNITASTITATTAFVASGSIGTSTPAVNAIYADLMPRVIGQINSTGSIAYAVNVSSVTKTSTGNYRVNFKTNFASSSSYVCTGSPGIDLGPAFLVVHSSSNAWTAHGAVFRIIDSAGAAPTDRAFHFACFGAQ